MLSVIFHSCNSCLICFLAILGKTHRCEFEIELVKRSIVLLNSTLIQIKLFLFEFIDKIQDKKSTKN